MGCFIATPRAWTRGAAGEVADYLCACASNVIDKGGDELEVLSCSYGKMDFRRTDLYLLNDLL